jgi:hypothetical protein
VLYLDREDEPERHRGAVVRLQGGVFAPSAAALRFLRPGTFHVGTRRLAYTDELRALWRRDPGAFLALIELATGGNDLTLVDDFGDADDAPRRILGAALKQIAKTRRDEARRKARRTGRQAPRRVPSAASRRGGGLRRRRGRRRGGPVRVAGATLRGPRPGPGSTGRARGPAMSAPAAATTWEARPAMGSPKLPGAVRWGVVHLPSGRWAAFGSEAVCRRLAAHLAETDAILARADPEAAAGGGARPR